MMKTWMLLATCVGIAGCQSAAPAGTKSHLVEVLAAPD